MIIKLLLLTHRYPWPPDRGDKIRSYHILKFLADHHQVVLLSFAENPSIIAGKRGVDDPVSLCKTVEIVPLNYGWAKLKAARALLSSSSLSEVAFHSKKFSYQFRKILTDHQIDLVMTDSSALAFYPLKYQVPFIADFMDVDSEKWMQFSDHAKGFMKCLYRREARQLALFEARIAEKASRILVVSQSEKMRLTKLAPHAKVAVVPNGVDTAYFTSCEKVPIPGRLVFVGVMDYLPNIDGVMWFCREVWPDIRRQVPEAQFSIVGANPTSAVRSLSQLPGVRVEANVADVREYLREAEVCVVPLRFAIGLQNKVIQALAMGKAVVATEGAIQGMGEGARKVLCSANTAADFSSAVVSLLKNSVKRKEYEGKGPSFVQEFHCWEKNLSVLEDILNG